MSFDTIIFNTTHLVIGLESAQAFWGLLLPHGLQGGALAHTKGEDGEDVDMENDEEGWMDEHSQWWFDFLNEKGVKGISKDTWVMVCHSSSFPRMRLVCLYIFLYILVPRLRPLHQLQIYKLRHGRFVLDFPQIRATDAHLRPPEAWPSTIDDFVEWAKKRLD